MRTRIRLIRKLMLAVGFACSAATIPAAVHYVDINSPNPEAPYTSWASAATNIQDAVDAAASGDQIIVTNGVYASGGRNQSRLDVDKAVDARSVNGPEFTFLNGSGTDRCAILGNGATLSGFTLTNGFTPGSGGGVAFARIFSDAIVSNCVIEGCFAKFGGAAGSLQVTGGEIPMGGKLINCRLRNNSVTGPFNPPLSSLGGAVDNCQLNACVVSGNFSAYDGGAASTSILYNCLITGNHAGGVGGAAIYSTLVNCTVVSNNASFVGGVYYCNVTNSIVYYNSEPNHFSDRSMAFTCTIPLPDGSLSNITNAPLLAPVTFRLQRGSPCIDTAAALAGPGTNDLDGRVRPLDGNLDGVPAFDMGAYEHSVLFVRQDNATPVSPFTSWANAATNIQDAVDAAHSSDEILVTNGVFRANGNESFALIYLNKTLSVRSVNGPRVTVIEGKDYVRCARFSAPFSELSGFTLTRDIASGSGNPDRGGAVMCPATNCVVTNCIIAGNVADYGGAAAGGTLVNCVLSNNTARFYGGGAYGSAASKCVLINCLLSGNMGLSGGGAATQGDQSDCLLIDCVLTNNSSFQGGAAMNAGLINCLVRGNTGSSELENCIAQRCFLEGTDRGADGAAASSLYNCVITGYIPYTAAKNCFVWNCTVTRNAIGMSGGHAENSILYDNWQDHANDSFLRSCCTRVLPQYGDWNITNAPLFIDSLGGNFRLQAISPCINAGDNSSVVYNNDFDVNPRIKGGTVDIGAFEFQNPGSTLSYAWAQQYGIPTDGSADNADPDFDGLNNWQEWVSGTNPTNAASALRMLLPVSDSTGIILQWQSVSRTYFLERSTNLGAAFMLVSSNIVGQPSFTTFVDTNSTGPGPVFYRVGVRH